VSSSDPTKKSFHEGKQNLKTAQKWNHFYSNNFDLVFIDWISPQLDSLAIYGNSWTLGLDYQLGYTL
jgi:hypothetical protein